MSAEIKPNFLKPRWSKVFTDLWEDKTRTWLVVASIAAGAFAIGMIISSYVILGSDINPSYAAVNPPNIEIWTGAFDRDLVQSLEKVPGVDEVQGRRLLAIRARKGAENWQSLTLVGVVDFNSPINHLIPIEGSAFPDQDEAIVSQDLLHSTGFHPGDEIEIELPDGSNQHLTVVGLVTDQTASKPDVNSSNNVFITMKTLRSFGMGNYFNQLYVTVVGDGSDRLLITHVADSLKDKLKESQREVYLMKKNLSTEHPMTATILAVIGVLGALGGLITLLSSSLIINTLNALLTQQLRQIGIMKLVGARSLQILGMYLTLIVAYSLIALALAVPLGALAGYGLAWLVGTLMGAVMGGFRFIPVAVVAQVLIAVLIPLGAGYFPVNSGVKTHVQQAISNSRPADQTGKRKTFNLNAQWFGWIPRPILLSFRNTFRKRGRLLLTIFTLTVAGAVFIAVFNVRDSMATVVNQVMMNFMGDVTVTFRQPYDVNRIKREFLTIPGVKYVEAWGGTTADIWDQNDKVVSNLSIAGPPQNTTLLAPEFVAGRWLLPGEKRALVVSDTIYDHYPNIKPGDTLIIKIPGQLKADWVVVGIFHFVNMSGDIIAYANFEYIAELIQFPGQAASYRVTSVEHDTASELTLTRRINEYLLDRNYLVQNVQSGYLLRDSSTQAINVLIIFLLIMAILTAFVGSIGLTGTMSINVLERTREIGVMRTIGAVDLVIMQSVIIEGLVIGLITWSLAIGLSFPISTLLLTIIGQAISGSAIALSFTPLGILLWLAVVIVLSIIASIMPARNATRLTINEVLAYE